MTSSYKLTIAGITSMKVVIVIALALLITGCGKDEEKAELVKIDRTLYPFLFDQGTHWIYQKVNSDPTDTVTVIQDSISVESITKDTLYLSGNTGSYEYYNIRYYKSLNDSLYDEQLLGYVISRGLNNGGFMLLSSKKKGDKSMNAEIVNVSEEMKVEDVVYKQVVKMKVLKDQYIDDNYFFYYVDRVGIIKKEKVVNDTIREIWNLKRYTARMLKVQ